MIRWATISLLAGLLVIGVLYDRSSPAGPGTEVQMVAEVSSPVVYRPGPLTAVWYCPVGSADAGGFASHEIAITNTGTEPAIANLTVLTDDGPSIALRQEIQPAATSVVDLPSLGSDSVASALVEIVGGEGLVGHTVVTSEGPATGPCATDAADEWFFAGGATTRGSQNYLVLMNPFGEDAVFDAEFRTETRTRRPNALRSDVVKARSTKVIDVTEHVSRADMVSAEIDVTVGRLVVERLQTFDGELGPKGAALTLGVATPKPDWFFPAGRVVPGADHRLVIYNPGESAAEVDVSFMFDDPSEPTAVGLVPIELSIAAGRFESIDIYELANGLNLELPLDVGLAVQSADDAAVVAERWQLTPSVDTDLVGAGGSNTRAARFRQTEEDQEEHEDVPEDQVDFVIPTGHLQPNATTGIGLSRGTPEMATEWLVPRTILLADNGTVVAVSSIEGASVEVRLLVGGELQPPIRASVPAGGRVVVPVGSSTSAAPFIVTGSAPIAVEVQLVEPGIHLDVAAAVPVSAR
jgi:hypothetical protein